MALGSLSAQAQTSKSLPAAPGTSSAPVPLTLTSFAAAHDTLMQRVARSRSQSEALIKSFAAREGTMGGLHRRVKAFAGPPRSSQIVKKQVIKRRFGVELEKLSYYDGKGRKVLVERYEGRQLVHLELFEYSEPLNLPVSSWLFVRGDYVRYTSSLVSHSGSSRRQTYFFKPNRTAE